MPPHAEIPVDRTTSAVRTPRAAVHVAAVVAVAAVGVYASTAGTAEAAPWVVIDAPPKPLTRVGGTVPLHVRSRGADRIIMRVDGKPLAGWRTRKRTVRWNTRDKRPGLHLVTVTATDRSGRERTARRTLRVDQRRAAGAPRLTVKLRGHRAARPGPIRITARPLSYAGIHSVEWRVDGRRVATARKRPFVWTWRKPTAGRHRITVRAIDAAGRRRTLGYTVNVPREAGVTAPGGTAGGPASRPAAGTTAPNPPSQATTPPPPVVRTRPYSDDFNSANLDTGVWTFVDPLAGGRVRMMGTGTADAHVALSIPAGPSRDVFGINRSTRIMQPAANGDLDIHARFLSNVTQRYQTQGFIVEQDDDNWLRFEMHNDGAQAWLYAASTTNGATSTRINVKLPGASPQWLRVTRSGNAWGLLRSGDGQNWVSAGQFTHVLNVTAVGLMAANANAAGSGTAPAHTALVDYFFNTKEPIAVEDGAAAPDTRPPLIHDVSATADDQAIHVRWATDERASTVVRYGPPGAPQQESSAAGLSFDHAVRLTGLGPNTTYQIQLISTDTGGRQAVREVTATTGTQSPVGSPQFVLFGGRTLNVGSPGIAQDVANVLGNVSDPDGVASLTYSLNGGPQRALSLGPDNRRLEQPGDFNAEVPVSDMEQGANYVVLRATDTTGAVAATTVTVNRTVGATWPLPYTLDWASNAVDAQVVDGKWSISAAGARSNAPGYDRLIAIGDRDWTDYEVRVPVTVHSVDTANGYPFPSNGPVVGLGLRWQGHTQAGTEQPRMGFFPAGAYAWYRWRPDGIERFEMDTQNIPHTDRKTNPAQIQVGTEYMMVMRVTTLPSGRGRYQFRMWPAGQPEPSTWTVQNDAVMDLESGSVLLIAHHVDATFGDVTVIPQ